MLRMGAHKSWLPAWIRCWLMLHRRLTLITEEHEGKPSKQRSRNWLILSHGTHTTALLNSCTATTKLHSLDLHTWRQASKCERHYALARTWCHCNNDNAIKNKKWSLWRWLPNETYKPQNSGDQALVRRRFLFAPAFSSPHPFVAFVLSESLETRLKYMYSNETLYFLEEKASPLFLMMIITSNDQHKALTRKKGPLLGFGLPLFSLLIHA